MSTVTSELPGTIEIPDWVTSETRFEILDGEFVEMEPMSVPATWICTLICQLISEYARRQYGVAIPEMLVEFPGSTRRRRPDGIYISYQKWPKGQAVPDEVAWEIVPDMCLEVTSPTDRFHEVKQKTEEYFSAGVSQVWIVTPSTKLLEIFESPTRSRGFKNGEIVDCTRLIPGFQLNLADIF
jgi:Uma2 family endonuclease